MFRGNNRHGKFNRKQQGFGGRGRRPAYRQKFWSVSELERVITDVASRKATVTEEPTFAPKNSFETFEINKRLVTNILSRGYKEPTPIQDKVIPVIINQLDVIGLASTGTGKTAAFLIPLLELVMRDKSRKTLILTPTRELALQIYEEFRAFSNGLGIYTAVLIGGSNIDRQKQELKRNPSFVIATPGRLKDLLKQKAVRMNEFTSVVLDETDRMVDIGFIQDIKYFISLLPEKRLSMFFSATITPKVEEILNSFVKNPVTVKVKQNQTSENIEQKIIKVPHGSKVDALHNLLVKDEFSKVLVFGTTKWGVQKLADELASRGHKSGAIHGNKSQMQRQQVLKMFKTNEIKVLLATDVASRGLDIKDVSHVINYDMPETYEDYIHRIGRTGRANKKGIALTIVEGR